jgi:gliding motility-associated-like protein
MKYTYAFLLAFLCYTVNGQVEFDDCSTAKIITDPGSYCSANGAFDLTGTSDAGYGPASCWTGVSKDMWFQFTAVATGVNIVINGKNIGSTLQRPQAALYQGNCGSTIEELDCETDNGTGGLSLSENGLIIGATYLIRVSGENSTVGKFQLCINNFNPPVLPGQDCPTGAILCDKNSFVVQSLSGTGLITDEGRGTCLKPSGATNSEDQSIWFRWTAANNGTLTFDITPLRSGDDIDFALFELPGGIEDCNNKVSIRCNATACDGPTGLNETSIDLVEDFNCDPGEDRYVKYIDMEAGKSYGLLINNFDNTGIGIKMDWGGTGEFQGPKPDFTIDPLSGLRCDQDFTITDVSINPTGTLKTYDWNFGLQALPKNADTKGPHKVNYASFGKKYISLTVASDKGCKVTVVKEIYAEPCCEDLEKIGIESDIKFVDCAGQPTGKITATGTGGTPDYFFKFNEGSFSPNNMFDKLKAGTYEVVVQDIKGCADSINVTVVEPEPIIVEAGPDQEIDLGDFTTISGTYTPIQNNDMFFWTPPNGVKSPTELTTEVLPPGTTTYILNVVNSLGCLGQDSLVIKVLPNYVVYYPNIIYPEAGGVNGIFNIVGRKSAKVIDLLEIYDRWGSKVYKGINISPFDKTQGWDGSFNGKAVEQGVYTWLAKIRFLDEHVETRFGDITVVRSK